MRLYASAFAGSGEVAQAPTGADKRVENPLAFDEPDDPVVVSLLRIQCLPVRPAPAPCDTGDGIRIYHIAFSATEERQAEVCAARRGALEECSSEVLTLLCGDAPQFTGLDTGRQRWPASRRRQPPLDQRRQLPQHGQRQLAGECVARGGLPPD